jgi:phage tail sheath protein FI
MPQYLSPGVYVEEVPAAIQPIAGVGTSTAGFIGLGAEVSTAALGDTGDTVDSGEASDASATSEPQEAEAVSADQIKLCTHFGDYKKYFGDFSSAESANRLAHGVYGFFNNGGTRCYVIRVASAAGVTKALEQFEAIDEIALVAAPGVLSASVQTALIDHCEKMGDRFALLDGQRTSQYLPDTVKGGVRNSNYAALYFPWIQVYDPASQDNLYVPPSAHVAGVYARVDAERGVHKAPANAVIRGTLGVESRLSKAHQDGLNPDGINVIRDFNGAITLWGARTLGGDANGEWKYVNVRRLFLFLRESIDNGTRWVVFEPNEPGLWAKITRNVTAFLTTVWNSGALFGVTPQEAFYVKCDAETNPPEIRDQGQVVTEIGVAVVRPAEFAVFRLSQWTGQE